MDQAWAETGDRYMLKLFRDYIFHQVNISMIDLIFQFPILCGPGDGGREAFLGHGTRDHQPQQARRRHPRQGRPPLDFCSEQTSSSFSGLFDVKGRTQRIGGELCRAQKLLGTGELEIDLF